MTPDARSIFFAYASEPPLRAEVMREVIAGISARGVPATGWESLTVDGRTIVDSITEQIDSAVGVLAEISSMNSNVLFELGYAIARNKPTRLAFDESDTRSERLWNDVSILSTVGRTDYSGSSEKLINQLLTRPIVDSPPLTETILASARPRESNAIFAPSLPIRLNAASALEKLLERQTHLKVLGSSEDLMIAPLEFYAREIYRSSASVIHLLGEDRRRATEHNARASFLAGFAHGLDLPVLMVVQEGFRSPLDYRHLLYAYPTSAALQSKVLAWLDSLPKASGTERRLGRLELDIELPIRTFGQYVAEYEVEELGKYFVQTSEFSAVVAGDSKIFVGRKGTGKTATMSQVTAELRADRGVLVVPIKPSTYEIAGLASLITRFEKATNTQYFLMTAWIYLIQSEIALQALSQSEHRSLSHSDQSALEDLRSLLQRMSITASEDLSTRLERVVEQALSATATDNGADHLAVAKVLRSDQLSKLAEITSQVLGDYRRVAVLIDNLDKDWERGEGFQLNAQLILSLLVSAGKIEKEFARLGANGRGLDVTLALFLRTDIFDVVRSHAREPDKISARTVDWADEELLVRVLEDRYSANRRVRGRGSSMWEELFCAEVRGVPTRDYFLWRALRRPRDFIYFANSALTTAINRRHSVIETSDVTYAEREYSRFAVEALMVESESVAIDLEAVLYEFAGIDATVDEMELMPLLAAPGDREHIRDWLVAASFLGLETSEGRFEYVEGEVAARRKSLVARRSSEKTGRPVRFRIHPAFRPNLEIRDDDLHD